LRRGPNAAIGTGVKGCHIRKGFEKKKSCENEAGKDPEKTLKPREEEEQADDDTAMIT